MYKNFRLKDTYLYIFKVSLIKILFLYFDMFIIFLTSSDNAHIHHSTGLTHGFSIAQIAFPYLHVIDFNTLLLVIWKLLLLQGVEIDKICNE